jgi:septum formation protein
MKIILASSSPRRRELLQLIGLEPQVVVPKVSERMEEGEAVGEFLRRVTLLKGESVFNHSLRDHLLISADTIVLLDDRVIGKPTSREEAFVMLRSLSANCHDVRTGISLFYDGSPHYNEASTTVHFSEISDSEIEYYLSREAFHDKAGAYAIQGMASVFVERIEGCYFNVMGFPLNLFFQMLKKLGINLFK